MTKHSDERQKLDALEDRLQAYNQARSPKAKRAEKRKTTKGVGQGMKLATDFVAAVAVGVFIGWLLDRVFGTLPLFLIVFFLFGSAAGILNMVRTAQGIDKGLSGKGRSEERDK